MQRPGLHKYDGIEAGGYDRGELGFLILKCPSTTLSRLEWDFTEDDWNQSALIHGGKPEKQFTVPDTATPFRYGPIGMYVFEQANAQWRSRAVGDDLANNGIYDGSTAAGTNYPAIVRGMFWGEFDKLSLWKPGSGTDYVKVLIGRWSNDGN